MIDTNCQKMEGLPDQRRDKTPTDTNNNNNRNTRSGEKYALRPRTIIKRLQQEIIRKEVPKRLPRSKSRPAPLSKYRRKTANARERHRMKQINNAFESLRKVLPDAVEVQPSSSSMTKITTLRLAVDYIRALSHVLEETDDSDLCVVEDSFQSSLQDTLHSSLQHSLHHTFQYKISPESCNITWQHQYPASHLHPQHLPQNPHLLGYCSSSTLSSSTSSPSTDRKSLGSASDLEELLSDDSGLLEDNFDVFHDIPTLPSADPFDILLADEKGDMAFTTELCN